VAEALECLGGNGYVEESPLPRLYRDAPLNSIWEGSGNVQCLEMLRAVRKDAGTLEMVLQEIRAARRGTNTSIASLIDLSANWPTRPNSKRVRAALPNF
jgi:putative acyl-CoA dehydrogenase